MPGVSYFGVTVNYSGGGYFRLLPYGAVRHAMKRSSYVMTYFHPRDFDPDQPVLPGLSLSQKIRAYIGLKRAREKFEKLISRAGTAQDRKIQNRGQRTSRIQRFEATSKNFVFSNFRAREARMLDISGGIY